MQLLQKGVAYILVGKKKNIAIIIKGVAYIFVGKRKGVPIDCVSVAYILLANNKSVAIDIKKCCISYLKCCLWFWKKVLHISNICNTSNKYCENLLKVLHLANATRFKEAL